MPAERRSFTVTRPLKTERTHEENQERAYIAASRRSDRSLEARIESARRASEIHKKRTGRALRVTEQDVINEEMYEEEDDDLPAQYQRLNAHLHTTSVMFNKKLHDYIATQHGVRNMFMSQYQNPPFQPSYSNQFSPSNASFPQANTWVNTSMPPPQSGSPSTPQGFQQAQPYSPTAAQGFRQSPYHIPQRPQTHQRSFSIQLPDSTGFFDPSAAQANGGVTTPQDALHRRMSLPPNAFEQQNPGTPDGLSHLSHSRSPPAHTPQSGASPTMASMPEPSRMQSNAGTPSSYSYSPTVYPMTSQVMSTNPLTLSLPPESQQLIGSALDPNDPRTALFMSGSDNLPQPFTSKFAFDSDISKSANVRNDGSSQTLSTGLRMKIEPGSDATNSVSQAPMSENYYPKDDFFSSGNGDFSAFFEYPNGEVTSNQDQAIKDQLDGNNLVNWD